MTVQLSRQAYAILDKRGAKDGITKQDITSIDTNKDNKISETEAEKAGLGTVIFENDVKELNKALIEYKAFSPEEVIFKSPRGVPSNPGPVDSIDSAGLFSPQEKEELKRFGIHPQSWTEKTTSDVTDFVGWQHTAALRKIDGYSETILNAAKRHKVNPMVLGAILYDEIRHVKPIIETVTTTLGYAETFGLAQLGNDELVRQNFFDQDIQALLDQGVYDEALKSKTKKPREQISPADLKVYIGVDAVLEKFPQELKDKGQAHLMDDWNSIDTLGKQMARIKKLLNIPESNPLTTKNFKEAHTLAKAVVLHSGRFEYAPRILEYG